MGRVERKRYVEMLHGRVEIAVFTVIQTELAVDIGVVGTELSGSEKALDSLRERLSDNIAMRGTEKRIVGGVYLVEPIEVFQERAGAVEGQHAVSAHERDQRS